MKKNILSILLVLAMTLPMAACGGSGTTSDTVADTGSGSESEEGGSGESGSEESGSEESGSDLSGTVVIYSTQTDEDHEVFLEIFNEWYPNVEVEFVSGSLGELMARVDAEKENPQGDVIFGGLSQSDGDTYLDLLQEYTPKYADENAVESNGYYTYFARQYMCLLVNTGMLEELGVEVNGYADLLQPELKGSIIQADPSASSTAWRQLHTMLALMGDEFGDDAAWKFQEDLIANCDGVITTSSSTVYKSVYNGEYAVGLSYDNVCVALMLSGAEGVEIVWPEEGNTVCAFGSGMIKDCPNPELAAAALDVMSSAEFQKLRDEVVGNKGTNTTYEVEENHYPDDLDDSLVELDFDMLGEQKAALTDKWTDLWATAN